MTADRYIEKLREISDKKYKLMSHLLALTKEQSLTITEEGLDRLDKLIADKQAIIDEMKGLDEDFDACFQHLKSELKVNSLDELQNPDIKGVKELQETIARIMEVVKETVSLEKENSDKAKKLLDAFGEEIKKLNQAKMVNSAYKRGTGQPPSYFIDKKK